MNRLQESALISGCWTAGPRGFLSVEASPLTPPPVCLLRARVPTPGSAWSPEGHVPSTRSFRPGLPAKSAAASFIEPAEQCLASSRTLCLWHWYPQTPRAVCAPVIPTAIKLNVFRAVSENQVPTGPCFSRSWSKGARSFSRDPTPIPRLPPSGSYLPGPAMSFLTPGCPWCPSFATAMDSWHSAPPLKHSREHVEIETVCPFTSLFPRHGTHMTTNLLSGMHFSHI